VIVELWLTSAGVLRQAPEQEGEEGEVETSGLTGDYFQDVSSAARRRELERRAWVAPGVLEAYYRLLVEEQGEGRCPKMLYTSTFTMILPVRGSRTGFLISVSSGSGATIVPCLRWS
jgi:hypothetical protein